MMKSLVSDKYDNLIERVLLFAYFIHQFAFVFSVSQIAKSIVVISKITNAIIIITFAIIILIDLYYFLRGKFSLKEIAIYSLIGIVLIISFFNYRSVMVLVNLVAISCFKNIDFKKAIRCYLLATTISFLLNIIISLITIYDGDVVQTREIGNITRFGLGFSWPPFAAHYFYSLVFSYIVYKDNISLKDYIMLFIINIILFLLTDTRAVFAFTIIVLLIDILLRFINNKFIYKVFGIATLTSYIVFSSIIILLSKFYITGNTILEFVNRKLSGRLSLTHAALEKWGCRLWGQTIVIDNHSHAIDSSFISMLVENGILVFVICIVFMTVFSYLAYKTHKKSLLVALFAIAIRSTFDLGFMALQFSPIVIMFMPVLNEYIREPLKSEY